MVGIANIATCPEIVFTGLGNFSPIISGSGLWFTDLLTGSVVATNQLHAIRCALAESCLNMSCGSTTANIVVLHVEIYLTVR